MNVTILDCEQGSEDWFRARMGIPTASEFKTIIGIKKDAREKLTRQTYMRKLAGEILTGEPMENYTNDHMERGKVMEHEARELYAFAHNVEPQRVGFIRNDKAGCSPDSLIGGDGGLEIKTALAHIQIDRLIRDELPPEHRAQVQGNIWLADREWWDFVSYCPRLPLLVKRVYRDNGYIATLVGAVNEFNEELAQLVDQVRRYGGLREHTPMLMAG
jgi:hypothetical protein